jgi:hypothetical protein
LKEKRALPDVSALIRSQPEETTMDRDPSANQIDPIERETPSTGENDTGEVEDQAARIMNDRRENGAEPKQAHAPVQTKKTPNR